VIAAKAVAFHEALQPEFATYQRQVVENARVMADEFTRAGLRLVAGGTDTHLMLVDVSVKGLTGKAVEGYLDEIGITVNKNAIPFDQQKPMIASGIRIGTPAITSRGMGADECREVARIVCDGLKDIESRGEIERLRGRVRELTSRYDVP
jgi:glycine hydroxymethyltransferase